MSCINPDTVIGNWTGSGTSNTNVYIKNIDAVTVSADLVACTNLTVNGDPINATGTIFQSASTAPDTTTFDSIVTTTSNFDVDYVAYPTKTLASIGSSWIGGQLTLDQSMTSTVISRPGGYWTLPIGDWHLELAINIAQEGTATSTIYQMAYGFNSGVGGGLPVWNTETAVPIEAKLMNIETYQVIGPGSSNTTNLWRVYTQTIKVDVQIPNFFGFVYLDYTNGTGTNNMKLKAGSYAKFTRIG